MKVSTLSCEEFLERAQARKYNEYSSESRRISILKYSSLYADKTQQPHNAVLVCFVKVMHSVAMNKQLHLLLTQITMTPRTHPGPFNSNIHNKLGG